MKNILITGANGFIAKHISRELSMSGCYVIGTSRTQNPVPNYNKIVRGVLGEPLGDIYEKHKIDVVIHCAYDKQDIDNVKNAEGTRIWADQAEKNLVGLQLFMSSLSADEDSLSAYGKKKFELEKWFLVRNQVVFRLGLVVGNGGLFQTMISMVKKSPVIPLIDMGRTLTYISDVETVSKVIRDVVIHDDKTQRGRVFYLQQELPVFVGDILREIRGKYKFHCIFVPIPYFMFSVILALLEKLDFLKIGININNLKGLRQFNRKKFRSDLKSLGYSDTPIELLIRKL